MTYVLPKRRTLVHKAIEPRKLSSKVAALLEQRTGDTFEIKFDGVHVILIKKDGKSYAFSRQGEPVAAAMDHVLADLDRIPSDNFVLFAEAYHTSLEHSVINGDFRRSYVAEDAQLLDAVVFDYVPLADFEQGACPVRYRSRRNKALEVVLEVMDLYHHEPWSLSWLHPSPVWMSPEFVSVEEAELYLTAMRCGDVPGQASPVVTDGYMRKDPNAAWKAGAGTGGESIKLKDKMAIDVPVLRVLEGKGKFVGMVGALVVKYGDIELTVGGGKMTDKERKLYWDFPNKIIGSVVEVHGLCPSAHGMIREPRFIRMRPDKGLDEVDTN